MTLRIGIDVGALTPFSALQRVLRLALDGLSDGLEQRAGRGRVRWLAVGGGVDLPAKAPYLRGVDSGVAVRLQREPGERRDSPPGRDEGLHHDDVVAEVPDAGSELSLQPAHREQLLPAPFASADPIRVAMLRDAVARSPAHEVDRVVDHVDQSESLFLGRIVRMPVGECDVDLAGSQRL